MDFESFVSKANSCKTPEELYRLFTDAMMRFGFDKSIYSFLTHHHSVGYDAGHGLAHNYPEDWQKYYVEKKYFQIDPVPKNAFKTLRAFSWDKMTKSAILTAEELRVMNEAEEAQLRSGVGIPLYGINNEIAGFGLANTDGKVEITDDLLNLLQAYAHQFHINYLKLIKKDDREVIKLTEREKEVLLWFAEGKSLGEIGTILGISDETVRSYRKTIYEKLGANQRTLAVLKAVHYGLVHPYRIEI